MFATARWCGDVAELSSGLCVCLKKFMNLKQENFFQYFQEDEDDNTTFPGLSVPTITTTTTPFDDFTLHDSHIPPPSVEVEQDSRNGFKPWKWKSPLSPIPKRKNAGDPLRHGGYKRKLTKSNYHEDSSVRNQLQDILANLGPECPFFLKSMIHCNVVHGFSLTLPKKFCYVYLPFHDATIILEDERGEEYRMVYLGDKRRLSGGWRRFCVAQNLVLGDLLVFHLVSPLKFKVCRVEPNSLTEVDAAFILLKLSLPTFCDAAEEYHPMPPEDVCQDNNRTKSLTIDAILQHGEDQSEDYNDHCLGPNLLFRPGLVALEDVRSNWEDRQHFDDIEIRR